MQGAQSMTAASKGIRNDQEPRRAEREGLLEKVVDKENLNQAFKRVKANRGSHGIDGMEIEELLPYLKQHGASLKQEILEGRYQPSPVRRVEIPKPDGGIRLLGIPTVVDRMIQQAIAQVLNPIFEPQCQTGDKEVPRVYQ
jgi:RNA-directed DNA polymerase